MNSMMICMERKLEGAIRMGDFRRNDFLCSLCRKKDPSKAFISEKQIGGIDESTGEIVCRSCLELTIQSGKEI